MTNKYSRLKDDDEENGNRRKLTVHIYEGELNKIKNWVLQYEHIETGGDLFGLWIDSHTAVVQFALGPGLNCRRTPTSFFQDLDYLEKVGKYLTKTHGLCNIGQWHSHHQLSLSEPSTGDETTVWGNMPKLGLTRYIVCIANILRQPIEYKATVNCYLFEIDQGEQLPVLHGRFKELKNEKSPVNKHHEISRVVAEGAESGHREDGSPRAQNVSPWYREYWKTITVIVLLLVIFGLVIWVVFKK